MVECLEVRLPNILMPNHKTPFVTGQIYHIYNRGVEKRTIFTNTQDYFRCVHDLFEFNDSKATTPSNLIFKMRYPQKVTAEQLKSCLEVSLPNMPRRDCLVRILAFCLMPNHFHLLVQQRQDKGITRFMRKLGTGYTNYFNLKYGRVGSLFQGVFKAAVVEKDVHFNYLPWYIHTNPLSLFQPSWHKEGLQDIGAAIEFLENYRWSSLLDYWGIKNFPSVIQSQPLLSLLGNPSSTKMKKDFHDWLSDFIDKKKSNTLSAEALEISLDLNA